MSYKIRDTSFEISSQPISTHQKPTSLPAMPAHARRAGARKSLTVQSFFRRVTKRLILLALLGSVFSTFAAKPAYAGLFSFLGSIFSNKTNDIAYAESAAASTRSLSSMPLLDAPTNTNAHAGKREVNLTLVQDSALLPAVGPLGSIADVDPQTKSDQISLYTVRTGDNISTIAHMFGVSVNTIMWANDLQRARALKPGQVLIILPVSGTKHAVQKGDTLASIAKKYKGDMEEIMAFNDLEPGVSLQAGQEIIIPDGEMTISAPVASSKRAITAQGGLNISGYFQRPIAGGMRTQGIHGYNGVDLASACGTPIYAAAAGTAIVAKAYGWNGGYGSYIVISHPNGTQTLYAHNSALMVTQGQYVAQGQLVGSMGSTGQSTGCHLHFEVRGAKNPF